MVRLSEDSIARVLYYVHAEMIRDGVEGLEHADALLRLRGHDPDKYHVPAKRPQIFKGRGSMRRAVMAVLKQGSDTTRGIATTLADEHGLDVDEVWRSVGPCLSGLKKRGMVTHDGAWRWPVWGLI